MIRKYPKETANNPSVWQEALRLADAEIGHSDRTIRFEGDHIVVEWTDRLQAKLENAIPRVQAGQRIAKAIIENRKMGKLHEVAQRIARTRQTLSEEADKLAAKLDGLDHKAPDAFSRAHAVIDQHSSDIDAMESELRQLSNLPLES